MTLQTYWIHPPAQNGKTARIDYADGRLLFSFPFDRMLVAALKSNIPGTDRTWDPASKQWLVTPEHAQALQDLCWDYLRQRPELPKMSTTQASTQTTILEVRYVGRVKTRPDGSESAFGWQRDGWNVIFPGDVLRGWFGDTARPGEAQTLYAVLGIDRQAAATAIKKAYRRAALQWHPDHCSEQDAAEQFRTIQAAYEVLGDPVKRAKYEAGLMLETTLSREDVHTSTNEWQPPLRCGYVLASGVDKLGRFVVDDILAWEDIQDSAGRVLVTSWPMGADTFQERWV